MHLDSCVGSVRATCGTGTTGEDELAHSPRLTRLRGVMGVWWTTHQLDQQSTRLTPKHTPQDASRLEWGECACDVWGVCVRRVARVHLGRMKSPTRHV